MGGGGGGPGTQVSLKDINWEGLFRSMGRIDQSINQSVNQSINTKRQSIMLSGINCCIIKKNTALCDLFW